MNFNILTQTERQQITQKLKEQFGICEILKSWLLIKTSKEKLYAFSGNFDEEQIKKLNENIFIEGIGLYIGKIDEGTKNIRLSIEGTHLLKEQITKNIFILSDKEAEQWMKGQELNIPTPESKRGFLIIRYKDDFLGCGKASEIKISNFIPKERRIRS